MGDASESKPKLGDILIKLQLVDEDQVEEALDYQAKSGKLFGESLLALGFVGEDDLSWALSSQLGLPFVAATAEMADPTMIERYPRDFLRGHLVLPLVATDSTLSVVLADPTDKTTIARLERISGLELSMAVGTPSAIKRSLDAALGDVSASQDSTKNEPAATSPPPSLSSPELTQLVDDALTHGASRVHLDPTGNTVRVRFRNSFGELIDGGTYEPDALRDLVDALKHWLGDGTQPAPGITCWEDGPHSDPLPFRAMAFSGSEGTSLTLIMDKSMNSRHRLAAAYEDDWSRFDTLLTRSCGLIVAVAPTRHGREQVLARLLTRMDTNNRRICALIDDEVPLPPGMVRVGDSTPDSVPAFCTMEGVDVLTGVMENHQSLTSLAEAAGRDRLVVAALPGNGALGFLARVLESGVSSTLLSEALLAVVAQQTLAGTPDSPPRAVTETLFAHRPLRQALQGGGHIDALRQAATVQGFHEIAARVRDLDSVDETVLKDLERHRYLEDAA